jgi:hypothetical protein
VVVGRDEEGGLAAFYVDDVDFEVACGVLGAEGGGGDQSAGGNDEQACDRLHECSQGDRFLDGDMIDRGFTQRTADRKAAHRCADVSLKA